MLNAMTLLLLFQLLGEGAVRLAGLPLPGPVAGMLMLLAWLIWRRRSPRELDETVEVFLRYLALLFVPAGVGVMLYLDLLAQQWLVLGVTIVASTAVTLLVTGLTMQFLLKNGS